MTLKGKSRAEAENKTAQLNKRKTASKTVRSFMPLRKTLFFLLLLTVFVMLNLASPLLLQAKQDTSIIITTSEEEAKSIREYLEGKGYTVRESNGEINAWLEPPAMETGNNGICVPAYIGAAVGTVALLLAGIVAIKNFRRRNRYSEYNWDYSSWNEEAESSFSGHISLFDRLPSIRYAQEEPACQKENIFTKYAFCDDSHQFTLIRQQYS
jgi:hypothetical protein